jgi:phosphatidylinositol glycan class B
VIAHLRATAPLSSSVLFLMPCHSTPHQSHLHREDVNLRFLTCEPNLEGESNYVDEADWFFERPQEWLEVSNIDFTGQAKAS